MGLLSGLKKLGLANMEDAEIIEKKDPEKKKAEPVIEKSPEEVEAEAVFEKTVTCPVCDIPFKIKAIRPGRAKLKGSDSDLRPRYEKVDPIKYDAIACNNCGYAGLTKYFPHVSSRQMHDIKEQISPTFRGYEYHEGIYTYDDAIMRYKLALVTSIVKRAKNSERAYTALKLAWILRGKREMIANDPSKKEEIRELYKDELEAIGVAYEGFTIALSKEATPIANMDENTLMYLLADLARRLKKYSDASRLCGTVLTNKSTQPRLKERAHDLKEMIVSEMKRAKEIQAQNAARDD